MSWSHSERQWIDICSNSSITSFMLQIKNIKVSINWNHLKAIIQKQSWPGNTQSRNSMRIAELWLKHLTFQLLLSYQYLQVLVLDTKLIAGLYGQDWTNMQKTTTSPKFPGLGEFPLGFNLNVCKRLWLTQFSWQDPYWAEVRRWRLTRLNMIESGCQSAAALATEPCQPPSLFSGY